MTGRRTARREALLATGLTYGLMLVVAAGVADQGWAFAAASLLVASVALGGLNLLFPQGLTFAFGAANGLAVYVCLFVVMGRAGFPAAHEWARPLAFLLPVLAFVGACWWRRERLRVAAEGSADLRHFPRFMRWLLVSGLIGAASLASPISRLGPDGQTIALLFAMGLIAAIGAAAVEDVVRLLVDVATMLRRVTVRLRALSVPIATYVSLFALLAVAFGCAYRIADGLSREPVFLFVGTPARISFSEALHFSVVTLSTVGYGDIQPHDDGIRLLAALQMVLGQLLLLFGFAEIMRSHTDGERREDDGERPGFGRKAGNATGVPVRTDPPP
ncbi:potassium channel family protein [Rubritepida flocculans]|uniref:potassium channel family protein n=1 Tax=Rubritepida flocculans TaxID=182403 RepID=UPI0004156F6E|nr:potassium channel family protein [Rubritepida flocculans]